MIQVGRLTSFSNDEGEKVTFVKMIQGLSYNNLAELFTNIDCDLEAKQLDRTNLFYTVAHHLQGQRKFKTWQAQEIIPFDFDGINLERIDEYIPIACKTLGIDQSKCGVVYSGNGIHLLIQVPLWKDIDFIKKSKLGYRQLMDKLEEAFKEADLSLDRDTTAWDYARILRLPFSINVKVKEGKEVVKHATLVNGNISEQQFNVPVLDKPRDNFHMDKGSFPKPDVKEIISSCEFFKWLKDKPDEVHEPHAYAMLSIAGHFDDEGVTAKSLWDSFSSPSINSKGLGEFTEQALETSGPRTCEGINDVWGNCRACIHFSKIKSPILLKDKNFIGTEHCGFTLIGPKGGKIRQYDDLVKYLEREKHYIHTTETGQLFFYEEGYFTQVNDGTLKNFAMDNFLAPTKAIERTEFLNYARDYKYTPTSFLNGKENDGLINFKNGVLNINTGELLEHSPDYGFFYKLPYDYDANAKCPSWDRFLKEITLDRKELGNILEEYLGFIIRGGTYKYHKALILSGDGKNGKSTFNDVLKQLIGEENYSSTSLTKMALSTFGLSDLQGKLVNISEEEPPQCFKETGIFKNITGNNTVTAEKKFMNSFQMVNKAKIVITYNEMPFISDTSTGMKRRLMIVPFDLDLEHGEHKENSNIGDELASEISGIANRAIEGFKRLEYQKGFTKSKLVDAEVLDVMENNNPFYSWFNENVKVSEGEKFIPTNLVFKNYCDYMEDNNMQRSKLGIRKVSKMMKQKGFVVIQKKINGTNTKCYNNLDLIGTMVNVKF